MLYSVALADFYESQDSARPASGIEVSDGTGSARPVVSLAKKELFGWLGILLCLLFLLLFLLGVVCFVIFAWINLTR